MPGCILTTVAPGSWQDGHRNELRFAASLCNPKARHGCRDASVPTCGAVCILATHCSTGGDWRHPPFVPFAIVRQRPSRVFGVSCAHAPDMACPALQGVPIRVRHGLAELRRGSIERMTLRWSTYMEGSVPAPCWVTPGSQSPWTLQPAGARRAAHV